MYVWIDRIGSDRMKEVWFCLDFDFWILDSVRTAGVFFGCVGEGFVESEGKGKEGKGREGLFAGKGKGKGKGLTGQVCKGCEVCMHADKLESWRRRKGDCRKKREEKKKNREKVLLRKRSSISFLIIIIIVRRRGSMYKPPPPRGSSPQTRCSCSLHTHTPHTLIISRTFMTFKPTKQLIYTPPSHLNALRTSHKAYWAWCPWYNSGSRARGCSRPASLCQRPCRCPRCRRGRLRRRRLCRGRSLRWRLCHEGGGLVYVGLFIYAYF